MSAAITTTAITLEGQAVEVLSKLQQAEKAYSVANPNTPENRVSISPNVEANEITFSVTLPATFSVVGGAITQTSTAYLP